MTNVKNFLPSAAVTLHYKTITISKVMKTIKKTDRFPKYGSLLKDISPFTHSELDKFLYEPENRTSTRFDMHQQELSTGNNIFYQAVKMKAKGKIQSSSEEIVNTTTHAVGVLLILLFLPVLISKAIHNNNPQMIWSLAIFGFGMFMAYLASTMYHLVKKEATKRKLRVLDHIGIFLLIGGTYTPIVCKYTDTTTAIYFLSVMWSLIVAGSVLKVFFTGRFDLLSTIIYLFLGWMVVFIIQPLQQQMPMDIFLWILGGGVAYTTGVVFYRWHSLKYQHGIWHLFVLAGTVLQFIAIYKSV